MFPNNQAQQFNVNPRVPVVGGPGDGNGPLGWLLRLMRALNGQYKWWLIGGASCLVLGIGATIAWVQFGPQTTPKEVTVQPQQKPQPKTSDPVKSNDTPQQNSGTNTQPTTSTPNQGTTTSKSNTSSGGTASSNGSGSSGSTSGGGGSSSGGGGGNSCPLPSYPDASCTGVPAGTSLTLDPGNQDGDVHLGTAGMVYENKIVNGCVWVEAPNITIRKTKITCGFAFGIHALDSNYSGGGLLIQDVEVSCGSTGATGIAGYGFTAERVNVHDCENGFSLDHDATVKDSYIHSLYHGPGAHTDGIQLAVGSSNILMQHNYIDNDDPDGTSAIIGGDSTTNITITQNLLSGGGFTLFCAQTVSGYYVVTNNRFGSNGYGPWVYCDHATQVSGNVMHSNGQPISP